MIFAAIHSYLIVKFVLDCFGLFGLIPRNDAQPGVTARPIGESGFADSGEGLNINRTITHPSLPSYREGTRADTQLTYSPRPLWERAEFVSELCELRNSGEGLKNYHSNHYPPTPFGNCLGFAPRSQNLTFGAELLSVRYARYPDYLTNVRAVRPQIRFPRKGGRCKTCLSTINT